MKNCRKNRRQILKLLEKELTQDDEEEKNWKGIVIALLVILAIGGLVGLAIFIVSLKNAGSGLGEPFTLNDLVSQHGAIKTMQGGWLQDIFVHKSSKTGDILLFNPSNNKSTVVFPDNMMKSYEHASFQVSPDFEYILISFNLKKLSNGQKTAKYLLYTKSNGSRPSLISFPGGNMEDWDGGLLTHVSWTQNGNSLVFVYKNNLFFQANPHSIPSKLTDETPGFSEDMLLGMPDFLYSEEIFKEKVGYWLSPDAKSLAYIRLNQSNVPKHNIPNFQDLTQLYPTISHIKYPKAGDTREGINPTIQLMLAETNNPKMSHLTLAPPSILANEEHYLTLVKWLDYKRLLVVWSNRAQTMSVFTVCVTGSEECKVNLIERQHKKTGWVFVNDVLVIKGGDFYLMLSPQIVGSLYSFQHIALVPTTVDTVAHKQYLTYGRLDVTEILAFSETTNELFYIATNGNPRERHLFKLKLPKDLSRLTRPIEQPLHYPLHNPPSPNLITCLTCRTPCKYATASFSQSAKHFLLTCLGPDVPTSVIKTFVKVKGEEEEEENDEIEKGDSRKRKREDESQETTIEEVIVIEGNEKLRNFVATKALPEKHPMKYTAEDGTELVGQLYTPPVSNKDSFYQFPLLIYVDGRPGTQTVDERFRLDFTTFLTSSEGVMVATFDGRGSSGRGVRNLHEIYKHLGTLDLEDLLHGIEHIKLHEKVNKGRMALWGQAYGGFLVSHVMALKGNSSINCGIAVSPITDFKLFNTAFTERYMGRPSSSDNYRGYDNANVLRKVKHFRNKKFFLAHGMADEKVHFQNSGNLASSLTEEHILFHEMFYPSTGHDLLKLPKTALHLYVSMLEFLKFECWSDKQPGIKLKSPKKKFKH